MTTAAQPQTSLSLGGSVAAVKAMGGTIATQAYDLIFVDQGANGGAVVLSKLGRLLVGVGIGLGAAAILWRMEA